MFIGILLSFQLSLQQRLDGLADRIDVRPGRQPSSNHTKYLDRATMRDQAGSGRQVRILRLRGEAKICREP